MNHDLRTNRIYKPTIQTTRHFLSEGVLLMETFFVNNPNCGSTFLSYYIHTYRYASLNDGITF